MFFSGACRFGLLLAGGRGRAVMARRAIRRTRAPADNKPILRASLKTIWIPPKDAPAAAPAASITVRTYLTRTASDKQP